MISQFTTSTEPVYHTNRLTHNHTHKAMRDSPPEKTTRIRKKRRKPHHCFVRSAYVIYSPPRPQKRATENKKEQKKNIKLYPSAIFLDHKRHSVSVTCRKLVNQNSHFCTWCPAFGCFRDVARELASVFWMGVTVVLLWVANCPFCFAWGFLDCLSTYERPSDQNKPV